jgi:hypothetical protein
MVDNFEIKRRLYPTNPRLPELVAIPPDHCLFPLISLQTAEDMDASEDNALFAKLDEIARKGFGDG